MLSNPELTSLIPWRLSISHSSQNRSPHGRSESAFRFLAPIYNPDACRDDCNGNRQRSHTSNPNELAPLHFPSSKYCHTTLVHFYALRTFPVCTHLHVNSVPMHSQVHRKLEGRRCEDRAAWTGRERRARAGEVGNGGAWRIWREVNAGTREWRGQHPVAAHLIPLWPTCHFKC